MKANFKIFLLLAVILANLRLPTSLAEGFSDLPQEHKNYQAIIHLQANGIVNGYADGTFKPDQKVNRAEFLKIIIKGSKISTEIDTPSPFPDADNEAWYAPYLRKAFAEGWINGYPDGTFKPEQTINKVESIKILGKVQKWTLPQEIQRPPYEDVPLDAWYTPYVTYAKDHQYLESSNILAPAAKMTRGSISQVLYNSITVETASTTNNTNSPNTNTSTASNTNTSTTPNTTTTNTPATSTDIPDPEPTFVPVTPENIPHDIYENIILDDDLPNTFYKKEVYVISGTIKGVSAKTATVILNTENPTTNQSFSSEVIDNHFDIPVHFKKSGNYLLGLIPGESGKSKAPKISVLSSLPQPILTQSAPPNTNDLSINFSNDKTSVKFTASDSTIKKLHFNQPNQTVTYISRQQKNSISINYSDFENFSEGETSYYIETAHIKAQKPLEVDSGFITSETKKFTAAQHTFDFINKESITTTIADLSDNLNQLNITGTLKTDTKAEALITKPDGLVETVKITSNVATDTYFTQKYFKANADFSLGYKPSINGRYIIEINDKNSEPILNHPIYIGNIIPLIPDFFDLNQRSSFTGQLDPNQSRQDFLNLINKDREKHGFSKITLADELNKLAQAHSDDMYKNNFFSHYNQQNQTPNDRRLAAGIKTPVGENLAKDTSVSFAHYGLMRSGSHRNNILNPEWTRVGLGITQTTDGYLIVAQEFSINETTAQDLANYKIDLITQINKKRTDNNHLSLSLYSALDSVGKYLNDKVIQENATLTNSIFSEALKQFNINGSSQLLGRSGSSWKSILDSIIKEETAILESNWKLIGIDIQVDETGNLNTIFILNNGD